MWSQIVLTKFEFKLPPPPPTTCQSVDIVNKSDLHLIFLLNRVTIGGSDGLFLLSFLSADLIIFNQDFSNFDQ